MLMMLLVLINNLYSLTCVRVHFINKLNFLLPYETGGGAEARMRGGFFRVSALHCRATGPGSRPPAWEISLCYKASLHPGV